MKRETHSDWWNTKFTNDKTNNVIHSRKETFRQAYENFSNLCKRGQSLKRTKKQISKSNYTYNLTYWVRKLLNGRPTRCPSVIGHSMTQSIKEKYDKPTSKQNQMKSSFLITEKTVQKALGSKPQEHNTLAKIGVKHYSSLTGIGATAQLTTSTTG